MKHEGVGLTHTKLLMILAATTVMPLILSCFAHAQMYQYYQTPMTPHQESQWAQPPYPQAHNAPGQGRAVANLHLENRDAEAILRDQIMRQSQQEAGQGGRPVQRQAQSYGYDYQGGNDYYGHRVHGDDQVRMVMNEAQRIASAIPKRNGKAFIVIDKRNFQFYLYNKRGRLLRIGPVAIGKGRTRIKNFETPVGIYPIRTKEPVADWIRPDWYFIEENEPIPARWEDRRVPGFFRFKMVFYGNSYIHYAEATGGRLTHGCIGLDWQDAEAVFHTLSVGSYCIVIDDSFLIRLAKGEFPIYQPKKKEKDDKEKEDRDKTITATIVSNEDDKGNNDGSQRASSEPRAFTNLW